MINETSNQLKWLSYNTSLAIRNFLGRNRIELHRTEMSDCFIQEIIEAAGYRENHPHYDNLTSQVQQTFTMTEVGKFMKASLPLICARSGSNQLFCTSLGQSRLRWSCI
jgi:hypothetical protein